MSCRGLRERYRRLARCHVSTRLFLQVDLAVLHEEQLGVTLRARVLNRLAAALPPTHRLRVRNRRDPGAAAPRQRVGMGMRYACVHA